MLNEIKNGLLEVFAWFPKNVKPIAFVSVVFGAALLVAGILYLLGAVSVAEAILASVAGMLILALIVFVSVIMTTFIFAVYASFDSWWEAKFPKKDDV